MGFDVWRAMQEELQEAKGRKGATRQVRATYFRSCLITLARRRITTEVSVKLPREGEKRVLTLPFLPLWDAIPDDDLETLYDYLVRYFERDRRTGLFRV